jgi:hypothetical protein
MSSPILFFILPSLLTQRDDEAGFPAKRLKTAASATSSSTSIDSPFIDNDSGMIMIFGIVSVLIDSKSGCVRKIGISCRLFSVIKRDLSPSPRIVSVGDFVGSVLIYGIRFAIMLKAI